MSAQPVLVRNGEVQRNTVIALDDDGAPPVDGAYTVSFERLQRTGASASADAGVRVPNTVDIADAWPLLAPRPLIELDFPTFGDGRAYSQARLLRERFAYRGEIRATGAAVVADQAGQLLRCGFDAFVLRDDQKPDEFIAQLRIAATTQWYQRPSERPLPSSARDSRQPGP